MSIRAAGIVFVLLLKSSIHVFHLGDVLESTTDDVAGKSCSIDIHADVEAGCGHKSSLWIDHIVAGAAGQMDAERFERAGAHPGAQLFRRNHDNQYSLLHGS